MSLERRREPRRSEEKRDLRDSSFRRLDFRPLHETKEKDDIEEIQEKEKKAKVIEELTEIEKNVLEIAKEILKLKRYDSKFEIESESQIQKFPIIEKLYAKCIAKLSYNKGYSKEEIFLAIRSLDEKSYIVSSFRRTKKEILENKKLMKILNFIKENPGIHARDEKVEKTLNITRTPFLKHVMTLEKFKLIRSKKIGKTLHYFESDIIEEVYDKYKTIFLNPLIPKILEEFFKNELTTISEIGKTLDMYSGTILYHIKKLKELNIVKSTKNQSNKKIHLVNVQILKKYNDYFKEPDFSKLLKGL